MDTKKIGILIGAVDTECSLELYQGIRKAAEQYKISTCFCMARPAPESTSQYRNGEKLIFDIIQFNEMDALIVALETFDTRELKEEIRQLCLNYQGPVIAINGNIENAYNISTSNYECQRGILEHLVYDHHYKKINYVAGPDNNFEANERRQAYIDLMTELGCYDERRIFTGTFYVNDGAEALSYFEKWDVSDFDAIACGNDMSALAIIEKLNDRGIRVPKDVAVTGIDDINDAGIYQPGLTTVSKSEQEVGRLAIDLLVRVWKQTGNAGENIPQNSVVKPQFILRRSCGCNHSRTDYRADIKNFSDRHFSFQSVKSWQEACIAVEDFPSYLTVFRNYLSLIKMKSFVLLINKEFEKMFELKEYCTLEERFINISEDEYKVPIAYVNGMFLDTRQKSSIVRLKSLLSQRSENFVCSTLHFRELNFGVAIFVGCEFPFYGEIYWEWLNGMDNTLGSLCDRIKIRELYRRDALTNLYNRFGLQYYWDILKVESKKREHSIMIMFIDMDGLKVINDKYGHEEGDFAIVAVSMAMNRVAGEDLIAVRYGGDEFLLIGEDISMKRAQEYRREFEKCLSVMNTGEKPYKISATAGIYIRGYEEDTTLEACVKAADALMYKNKSKKEE